MGRAGAKDEAESDCGTGTVSTTLAFGAVILCMVTGADSCASAMAIAVVDVRDSANSSDGTLSGASGIIDRIPGIKSSNNRPYGIIWAMCGALVDRDCIAV